MYIVTKIAIAVWILALLFYAWLFSLVIKDKIKEKYGKK